MALDVVSSQIWLEGEDVSTELRWFLRRQCFLLIRGDFWDMHYADYMVRSYTALLKLMLIFSIRSCCREPLSLGGSPGVFCWGVWGVFRGARLGRGFFVRSSLLIARFVRSVLQQCGGLLVAWGVTSMHAVRHVCEASDRTPTWTIWYNLVGLYGLWNICLVLAVPFFFSFSDFSDIPRP